MFQLIKLFSLTILTLHTLLNDGVAVASESKIALYLECDSEHSEGGVFIDVYENDYQAYSSRKVCISPEHEIVPIYDEISITKQEQIDTIQNEFFDRNFEDSAGDVYQTILRFNKSESDELHKITSAAGDKSVNLILIADGEFISNVAIFEPVSSGSILLLGGDSLYKALHGGSNTSSAKAKYEFGLLENGVLKGEQRLIRSKEDFAPTRLQTKLGLTFGVQYELPEAFRNKNVWVKEVIEYPESGLVNPKTGKTSKGEFFESLDEYHENLKVLAFSLDHTWEMEKGIWRFYVILDGEEYISHEFVLY